MRRIGDLGGLAACLRSKMVWSVWLLTVPVSGWGQQASFGFNENVVYVDAAHGGADAGAHLGGTVDEKSVTLALAGRVKSALTGKGFSVVMSREGDASLTAEQRANAANHARPLACLLLHASGTGAGVAVGISRLTPYVEPGPALPWARAQAGYVSNSLGLRELLGGTLGAKKLGPVTLRVSTPPLDSLTCAALVVELEPLGSAGAADEGYQTKAAEAIAEAMVAWKAQVAPAKAQAVPATPQVVPATPQAVATKPQALPKPGGATP